MKIKPTTSLIFSLLLLFATPCLAQTTAPKQIAAKRVTSPIKLDGLIDDAAWKDAPAALGYTEFRPTPFKPEDPANKTEVYMLYNDEGIYLGGYCHERTKDSISTELGGRDGFGNNDFIGFIFDTYNDKINGFEYFVTPLGEQMDSKMSPNQNGNSEDFSWNAVWKSYAVIHDDGWSFEIFLPLSAIRFSKKNVQDWGLNITRRRQKTGQQYTWNTIDPNVNGFLTQEGYWKGLENIKPPLRLQFSPYFSTYINHFPTNQPGKKNWTSSVNGGMDVKYGINQAFTLDMTLVPDFGQVQSDNLVLNLTPFEQKYTENRPFFTEGTELFSKGNLFYPRRIGIDPAFTHSIGEYATGNDVTIKEPEVHSKLVNATKISGRTGKGLGIGVLNAVTNARYAVLEDKNTKTQRKVLIEALTNYNIIVLNQSLKHNSSVSLVNTNVWRSGKDYDANITAGLFDFNDKKNMWNVGGKIATSRLVGYLSDGKSLNGYTHSLYFGKTSGRFNFNIGQDLTNDKFNYNDLGYFNFNNSLDHYAYFGYRWTKPGKWYNNLNLNLNGSYSRQLNPSIYRNANINTNINGQLKNLWFVGTFIGFEPKPNDFFESHEEGRIFKGWSDYFFGSWFETNSSKKLLFSTELLYVKRSLFSSEKYSFSFSPRYRFSNKFSVNFQLNLSPQNNNTGYVTKFVNDIIFGKRDIKSVDNSLNFKYSFNDKMNINVRIRHYWSKVNYQEFFTLMPDGHLQKNSTYNEDPDFNINFFNVDAGYSWQFAPGSFITLVWKNQAQLYNKLVSDGYFKNFNNTMNADDNNNLSLKVIYFLDYLQLKNLKKKEKK